jgi:hypothetical protein
MQRALRTLALSISFLCALLATPAQATVQRAHVSAAYGVDSNTAFNCDAVHPCRFFQAATTVVSSGGEVVALDSGGYGTVNITQSISLIAPTGVYAGISVFPGANGITIATAGVNVTLRGLTINGMGGDYGILMTNGAGLKVIDCNIQGFTNQYTAGISINAAANVLISDVVTSNNNNGILLDGGANVEITRATAVANASHGIAIGGSGGPSGNATTMAAISDSIASQNGAVAFFVEGRNTSNGGFSGMCASCTRIMAIINSKASDNNVGMAAESAGATLTVSGSLSVKNRFYGFYQYSTSVFRSAGNNVLSDNAMGPTSGTIITGSLLY